VSSASCWCNAMQSIDDSKGKGKKSRDITKRVVNQKSCENEVFSALECRRSTIATPCALIMSNGQGRLTALGWRGHTVSTPTINGAKRSPKYKAKVSNVYRGDFSRG
jgi:hypothetical protein